MLWLTGVVLNISQCKALRILGWNTCYSLKVNKDLSLLLTQKSRWQDMS